jgi:hypothetical protein
MPLAFSGTKAAAHGKAAATQPKTMSGRFTEEPAMRFLVFSAPPLT